MLTLEQLKALLKQVCLNSLYLADYENDLGISAENVYNFLESYLESEEIDYKEAHPKATAKQRDKAFNNILKSATAEKIYNYYLSLDYNPLPIEED